MWNIGPWKTGGWDIGPAQFEHATFVGCVFDMLGSYALYSDIAGSYTLYSDLSGGYDLYSNLNGNVC